MNDFVHDLIARLAAELTTEPRTEDDLLAAVSF